MRIKKAVAADIQPIHQILNYYAEQDLLLPRSLGELYDHLRDYFVLETSNRRHSIRGVCGLGICWEDLAEIKSLAVSRDLHGKGYGKELVEACLNEARLLGLRKVFVLSYIPEFFLKLGFEEVEKSTLPHKIWADCLKCPKFPNCEEVALVVQL